MSHPAKNSVARPPVTAVADRPTGPDQAPPSPVRIVVDVSGGDGPIGVRVEGAVAAACMYPDAQVLVCGDEAEIRAEVERLGGMPENVRLVHAPERIGMNESPVQAVRQKKSSSISIGVGMVARGEADAFVSAGNTGAVAAASTLKLGRLKGVTRPGIAAAMQIIDHPVVVIDVGANVDSKPVNLAQWGIMANVFAQQLLGMDNPRVGLLNVGQEPGKGNELTRQAYHLLAEADLNFVGNVEPEQVFHGGCDIVVCDGFTGNVLLKMGESLMLRLVGWLKEQVRRNLLYMLGFALCKRLFRHLAYCADFSEYGGVPLLGVKGVTIITHGSSDARAIRNAVREARDFVRLRVNSLIESAIQADVAYQANRS